MKHIVGNAVVGAVHGLVEAAHGGRERAMVCAKGVGSHVHVHTGRGEGNAVRMIRVSWHVLVVLL